MAETADRLGGFHVLINNAAIQHRTTLTDGVALLLCSEAGSYITRQTIYVDGGLGIL